MIEKLLSELLLDIVIDYKVIILEDRLPEKVGGPISLYCVIGGRK